jgi:dipeptidyl aminopeptidase/acylaminoacyl peptidase
MRALLFLGWIWAVLALPVQAQSALPIEAFAKDQEISLVRISPDGTMLAFLRVQAGKPNVLVKRIDGKVVSGVALDDVKPTNIRWAGNKNLLITVSATNRDMRYGGRHQRSEIYRTFSFQIETRKLVQLLRRANAKLSSFGTNLGQVAAVDQDGPTVYIPALNENFELDLFKTDLERGRGIVVGHGIKEIRKWVLNAEFEPVARVLHRQKSEDFQIQVRQGKNWKAIYKTKAEIAPFSVMGLNVDQTSLVLITTTDKTPFEALYEMDLETGAFGKLLFQAPGYDLDAVIRDPYSNLIIGASWLADQDEYHWFDLQIAGIYKALKATLPGYAVRLTSWSRSREKFVVALAKPGEPVRFGVYDAIKREINMVASARPALFNAKLGSVSGYTYTTRDDMTLHAYLTLPPISDSSNLPLVVMPHGGPESRDSANFDWMTQMLASRGYAVFQPNFRGSDGYGWDLTAAGWGEWGKGMQNDITDGVQDLITKGTIDPQRICIVGASYGGYAALAGGAFTPDLYKCVVSIAGIGDLREMYDWTKGEYGPDHWVVRYWDRSMSGTENRNKAMRDASPVRFAKQFKAPVLLIHGRDDTVVHLQQSKRMKNALKRAKKDVRLVVQKNGDHWLSFEETRLETAREIVTFLDQYLQ